MIKIETHRVMGTDVVSVPLGTKLSSFGSFTDFTTIRTVNENGEPCAVASATALVGCTVPGGYLEIYAE